MEAAHQPPMALVRIHVVTYRRPQLLMRALNSLVRQSERSWVAEVLNDDPEDERVRTVIDEIGDARIVLSDPCIKRGGTGNFNYAFRPLAEPFASILEDDNWWDPEFLASLCDALDQHPEAQLAVGNERIWFERNDGSWEDSRRTIWPETQGLSLMPWRIEDKLGSAKLCNSSMLWRTTNAAEWRTPDTIPLDVTEHFRERAVPHPLLLVHAPLVNYSVTVKSYRDSSHASEWGTYQVMLIGSGFVKMDATERLRCADILWKRARGGEPVLTTTLITTGLAAPAARALWRLSTLRERCRWLLTFIRRFPQMRLALRAATRPSVAWSYLTTRGYLPACDASKAENMMISTRTSAPLGDL
jgi:hypothetical protein